MPIAKQEAHPGQNQPECALFTVTGIQRLGISITENRILITEHG
jgi:hypothetical protein